MRTISAGLPATPVDGNRRYYERRRVGAHYARKSQPDAPEAEIIRRYRADLVGRRILDLGVGAGRTTSFLSDLGSDYIGIDYSTKMIERCRGRFPGVRFEVMDARDLSAFPDASFDFVLFSKAGIDAVGHEDRLAIVSEVNRTLKDGGLFVFSSHNRNVHIPRPWNLGHFDVNLLRDPVRFAKRIASYPLGIVNYLRNARRKQVHQEYCVQVDSGDMYSLVHYRIDPVAQARQLECAGFVAVEAVGIDGRWLPPGEWETAGDRSIHYVCRNKSRME